MAQNAKNLRKMPIISSEEEVCFGDVHHANAYSSRKRLSGNGWQLMRFKGEATGTALSLSMLKTSGLLTNARVAAMNGQM